MEGGLILTEIWTSRNTKDILILFLQGTPLPGVHLPPLCEPGLRLHLRPLAQHQFGEVTELEHLNARVAEAAFQVVSRSTLCQQGHRVDRLTG